MTWRIFLEIGFFLAEVLIIQKVTGREYSSLFFAQLYSHTDNEVEGNDSRRRKRNLRNEFKYQLRMLQTLHTNEFEYILPGREIELTISMPANTRMINGLKLTVYSQNQALWNFIFHIELRWMTVLLEVEFKNGARWPKKMDNKF